MKQLDHERVVTLSADDLDAILEAIGLAADAGRHSHHRNTSDERNRISGIVEQIRGKFDL
jgi:hypothetical protein